MFCWYAGEKGGISSVWWHVRTAFEVCFVGLVVERICVWCLVIVFIFMGFGQAGAKRCGGCLKVINWGWRCKSQKGSSFHREGRVSLHVILLYCETLLQILLGIYCKKFYWIPLFTILLFYYIAFSMTKFMWVNFNRSCVQTFSCLIAWYTLT